MSDTIPPKRGRGRPKVDLAEERQKVRSQLWTPGLQPVPANQAHLSEVYLPPPPGSKGTVQYSAWARECFLELVRHGYNFSQAAEKLGYTYKWWSTTAVRDPEWAAEARAIVDGEVHKWEYPDLKQMPFSEFVSEYAGFGLAPHQVQIADALEDPWGKLVLVLGHPESGKSTLISLWYVLYRIAQDPNTRIALVTKSTPKAQDLLTRVKRHLTEEQLYENSPRNLVADFNGFKPSYHDDKEWSQDQIFVRHRTSGERDPTVQALGLQKQIYGTRLDYLILDDSLVIDNQITELQRERIDTWFDGEARSRAQRGQTVVNGTRLIPHDLYGQWKKAWHGLRIFRHVSIPAILNEYTEDEVPSWEDYWTLDGYDIEEEINGEMHVVGYQQGLRDIRETITAKDVNRWKLIYQQEDVEITANIFTPEHIDAALELGGERKMGQVYDHEILILGVDPATTGRAASVLIALDPLTRVRTVVDIFVGATLGTSGIRQSLLYHFWEKYLHHKIEYTVIETNFAKTLLGDETLLMRAEAAGTILRDHHTVGRGTQRGNKWDEEYGIAALAPLMRNGLLAFANGGAGDREKLQPLIDDMLVFPWADQQDALIALWVANGEALTPRHEKINQRQFMNQRGVPPGIQRRVKATRNT